MEVNHVIPKKATAVAEMSTISKVSRSSFNEILTLLSNVSTNLRVYSKTVVLSLYHNCDSTTIQLRYDDTTTHSTMTTVIEITICVRFDCDTTTIRLWRKLTCSFFANVKSHQMEAGEPICRSRICSRIAIVITALAVATELYFHPKQSECHI